jgi:hypothetical protein
VTQLRAAAAYAISIVTELQVSAGRLGGLAWARRQAEAHHLLDDGGEDQ